MTVRPALPVSALSAAITEVHASIISLIRSWSVPQEHYADVRSRARTPAAQQFVAAIRDDIEELERRTEKRLLKRREKSAAKFVDAIERFVGDLLRIRVGTTAPARIYRSIGKTSFRDDPVKYDMFVSVLEGLKGLELVGHQKGQTRYRKVEFDPGEPISISLSGRASRFWATGKLVTLAAQHGIDRGNISEHFAPEASQHPLVLKDYATGWGRNRESGPSVPYERTPETERLEADIRELNVFLDGFVITGGEHQGYIREFNNLSWKKGGRLYSPGEASYQQMSDTERVKMRINGEQVAEIDIRASQLTIYHAMVRQPLRGSGDPYARVEADREIAKLWTVATLGSGKPRTRWPAKMKEEYKKRTGKDLSEQAKAAEVGRKMLAAFPALKKLEGHSDLWGDLQFLEAEAVIGTMLILMRRHRVPSLSMHDGIIVPRSQADLAERILKQEWPAPGSEDTELGVFMGPEVSHGETQVYTGV